MMTRNYLTGQTLFGLVLIFAAVGIPTPGAQRKFLWQGAVKPERINVYGQPSTNESVVRTLGHGQVVSVVLEVRVSDSAWCRIAFPGEPEPIGYVLCLNLQQGNFTPKANNHNQSATEASTETSPNPSVLTNKDILDMQKAGLPADILVAKIKTSQSNFGTSPAQLQQLKVSGVPDAVILAMVQAPTGATGQNPAPAAPAQPAAEPASSAPDPPSNDGKVRVLVADSQSWETRGGSIGGGNRNGWGASSWISGGARPQTAEIIKTLNQRCPEIIVTSNAAKASFAITFDHEGGKALISHRNKIAVFNREGDVIFSRSTRELGNAVKDACQAMLGVRQ